MANCFLGMIEGDDRKQNCNEHFARSIPVCVSAAILFMVRGRKLALAVPQDGLQDGSQDGSEDGLQEGSEEITVSRIAMNTSPGASLCVSAAILSCGVDKDTVQDVLDSVFKA